MTDTMPTPIGPTTTTGSGTLTRTDSFSTADIHRAFLASATKPRNNLSLRIVQQDETTVPPPSPLLHSRSASSVLGYLPQQTIR